MYYSEETIAAVATPAGHGGVGIIRVSGPKAGESEKIITGKHTTPRFASYTDFRDSSGNKIDEGLVIYFREPHSYTGEDVVEFQCHGGPVVLNRLMQEILKIDKVRLADPGEFTKRAFLNGKIDLTQAEAIQDLINATSIQAAKSAVNSLSGSFSGKIYELLNALIKIRTYVEATIDFPDESIDFVSEGDVLKEWRHGLTLAETGEALTAPLVSIEYGIESCYDATLRRINRGHDFSCARRAVKETSSRGLEVGAHFILGLPGESRKMMLDECRAISELPLNSVKFHQLQLIKGTRMEQEYAAFPSDFETFSLNEYIDFMVSMLERLRPDLYIERIAGEVPPRFVSKTPWGLIRNPDLLHLLDLRLEQLGTYQGRRYSG